MARADDAPGSLGLIVPDAARNESRDLLPDPVSRWPDRRPGGNAGGAEIGTAEACESDAIQAASPIIGQAPLQGYGIYPYRPPVALS
jgi:hypothetical protein